MIEVRAAWLPWTQRLAETPPWSPLRLSLAIAAALGVAFVALEAAFDRFPLVLAGGHTRGDFRMACVMIGLLAYLPAAYTLAVSGARRALDEITRCAARRPSSASCATAPAASIRGRCGAPACWESRWRS